jgi:hypothetical protein
MELAVIDATSGYLPPDRRLRPLLQRIARHRLAARGIEFDSAAGRDRLGAESWNLLNREGDDSVDSTELLALVDTLEDM